MTAPSGDTRTFSAGPLTPPAPSQGYPYTSAGPLTPPAPSALLPRPTPGAGAVLAISGEQPYPGWSRWATVPGSSPGSPHVLDRGDIAIGGRADGEGELVPPPLSPTLQIPYFCRHLPPPAPAAKDTHTLLPAAPTLPAPAAKDIHTFLPAPPPRPRLRRSSPAPPRAGAVLAISGEQPYPGFLQDLPMCWTVGISRLGVGPTGRGNLFPLPCLQLPRHRNPCRPHPSRASRLFSRSRSCGYRHEKGGSASPRRRTSISSPACRRSRNGHPDRFITP